MSSACDRCEEVGRDLYDGVCDACIETDWWNYLESRVG